MNLQKILLEKGRQNKLGHFYLIETSSESLEAQKDLEKFVHDFIKTYYHEVEGHKQSLDNLMDHPDVFVLGNTSHIEDQESAFFTVEEAQGLNRFLEFKAVQSRRKFAVITEAHRINNIVANKWLKLLEEPHGEITIFLLNPRRQKLLETIHSRAIHLRLPYQPALSDKTVWNEFIHAVKELSLSQFLEKYSKSEMDLTFWTNELIRWEAEQADQPLAKKALNDWLKSFQEMELFHQPTATKWSLFYSFLKQHVLPRK